MIDVSPLQKRIQRFVRRIRNIWQIVVFLTVLLYAVAAIHYFKVRPQFNTNLAPYLTALENISLFIAFALLMGIFLIKRKYFSRHYHRTRLMQLMKSSDNDKGEVLHELLETLAPRFTWVWFLAFLVVSDGVLFYWLTFSPQYLHMFFIVGLFSLFLNYPREEMFSELPWQVERLKLDMEPDRSGSRD